MYKNCQREQSIQRQNHIVRTFMSLLDRQNYHEITVAELCRAAGVPRKAFYRYFDTREDIIRFMVDAVVLAYFRMENRPEQKYYVNEKFCQEMFAFWYEHRDYLRIMVHSECLGLFTEAFTQTVIDNQLGPDITHWSKQEQLPVTVFTVSGFISLLVYWVRTDFQDTPEEMGNLFYRMLTQPIF